MSSVLLVACEDDLEVIPDAVIEIANQRSLQGYPVTLQASISAGTSIADFEFSWDFGDGATERGVMVNHTFQPPGNYVVKLTITGQASSKIDSITIEIEPSLELVDSYDLPVDEPSGLSFGSNKNRLYTVSDKTGQIFELDLYGNQIRTLNYHGGDLEGISYDTRDSTLWVVDEGSANLIHLDTNGVVLSSQWIAGVSDGGGLEGIAVDPEDSRLFLLKEKDYSALLVLNDSLQRTAYERIGFAPDYSGLYYVKSIDRLWLLSHEASSVYLTDTSGAYISAYGFNLPQAEGLVFDETDSIFFIVDDSLEKLCKYKFWD